MAERLIAPVLKTGDKREFISLLTDAHRLRTAPAGSQRADESARARRVAACWAGLAVEDRQLVARVSPDLAERLEHLAARSDTGSS